MWYLRPFLELGNPDLLPMVAKSLASEENDWSIQGFVPYLASLEPSALESQLPTILANPLVAKNDKIREMLGHLAHMPLSVALEMLTQEGQPAITAIAAYGEDQLPALGKVFTAMKPEEVLAGAPLLRILRDASQAVFDKAMVPLLERKDATSAAWLRTNIPFQDGLKAYYAQALKSDVPELWLVGAAITLREGGYSSHEFLVKAAALPQASLIDAAIVTTRYLSGKLAGEGEALARILAACQDRALSSWLAIVPPDPALASVLAQRAADPAAANIIAMSLAPRLGQNRASWLPIVQAVVQAAHGKLNYLLPESERR
jgi:hypothetical protein